MSRASNEVDRFMDAACVPVDGSSHQSGTLDEARAILAAHPELPETSIYAAAILGHDEAVRALIAADPSSATAKGGTREWDALTCLCFSRFLKFERDRSDAFVRAATALLDAGADPNAGWFDRTHEPEPEWESAIYGAAGVAQHAPLTRLLLERGADPNDEETPYHAAETYDNAALQALVESDTLNADSLATLLLRKADWHDRDGIEYLLAHAANPNRQTRWGGATALVHAVLRDNDLAILTLFLDRGADPLVQSHRGSAATLAARRGRGDFLIELERRHIRPPLNAFHSLLAACAIGDAARAQEITAVHNDLAPELAARSGQLLSEFAGNGNTDGVRILLDLGVPVTAVFETGDGYWGVAPRSTALHVAAWRARHDTVKLLIARGADVNARDGRDRTPLMLAVSACVDSYWKARRSPESVAALLAAGATTAGVRVPSGYEGIDDLLGRHQE